MHTRKRPKDNTTAPGPKAMDAAGITDAGMSEDAVNMARTHVASARELIEHQINSLPLGQPLGSPPTTA